MDRITEALLTEFAREAELDSASVSKQFEHLATYVTVHKQFPAVVDTRDFVVGSGGDTGIDAIAIIANSQMITDIDDFKDIASHASNLEVTFIFVQAETSASFDSMKLGNFSYGVEDFFRPAPTLPRNDDIKRWAEIMAEIYGASSKFRRANPTCKLYYITTGKWVGDAALEGRRKAAQAALLDSGYFSEVDVQCVGADGLQKLYRQAKSAIRREFDFPNKAVVPAIPGVDQSYIGFLPALEFIKLIVDDDGDIIKALFHDNVRDWQTYNDVNTEIKETVTSERRSRFVLMNNGVTIIARNLTVTSNRFSIEDFQIVNGCQTSHVLWDARDGLDGTVMVPVRIIGTTDDEVRNAVIQATNRQTEVKDDQFFAMTDFSRKLEDYFKTFHREKGLFYERRTHQYDSLSVEKVRVVTYANLLRSFASMFLSEPHAATRNYSDLNGKVGEAIFANDHRLEPYYVAALTWFKLEAAFRSGRIDAKYKAARFHILLAARLLLSDAESPHMNSREMGRQCDIMMQLLWDQNRVDVLLTKAAQAVDNAAGTNLHRDNIRTQPFTARLISTCLDMRRTALVSEPLDEA